VATTTSPVADPRPVADRFLNAWAEADWATVRRIAPDPRVRADEALADWWRDLDVAAVGFKTGSPAIGAGTATVPFSLAVQINNAGTWEYDSALRLVAHDNSWEVAWSSEALHPTLGDGDRLELTTDWPERARITDRNGRPLVGSVPAVSVGLIPERIISRDDAAAVLEEVLAVPRALIDDILDRPGVQPDWFLPVATVAREDNVEIRPALYPVPGVAFRLLDKRVPTGSRSAAPLLGTTHKITAEQLAALGAPYEPGLIVGAAGLEAAFERQLAGTPTKQIVRRSSDESTEVLESFEGASPSDLQTTLSLDVQRTADAVLEDIDLPAAIVVVDAATGEIRAAATTPADGFSRATSGLYPPGSTFKIVVATAVLEGGLRPDSAVACPRVVIVAGREFGNATRLPTTMSLEEAFAQSCNTAFIQLATELDPVVLAETARKFGFNRRIEIGIPAADASYPAPADSVEFASAVIGQGRVLVSPLNLAGIAATAASGAWHPPTLVAGLEQEPSERIDPTVLADLQRMMRAVVVAGTGRSGNVPGMDVAGKTGTAQVVTPDGADSMAWFIGFSGELAFAVGVEGGESGGSAAAPIAAAFLEQLAARPGSKLPSECVAAGADWTMFQGDITRSGCSRAEPIIEPRRRWQAEVGISGWLNSPIVVDDLVVVGSAGTRRSGGDEGDGVYALDLRTGKRRWFFPTANDVNGVATADGIVVATGDEGTVWGLDLESGAEVWSFAAGSPVFTNPLIVDDLVVVGDFSGIVWGLGLDGGQRWRGQLDGPIRGGAASDGRIVYAVSDPGTAAAFTVDGFELWRTRIEHPDVAEGTAGEPTGPLAVFAAPTVAGDELIVSFVFEGGTAPAVTALDRYVGSLAWQSTDPNQVAESFASLRNSPARYGDSLIFASSLSEGVQALDATTGQAIWASRSGLRCERQWASPVVVNGLVLLPRPDGALHAYDATDGATMWRMAPAPPGGTPRLAVCTGDGQQIQDGFELQASVAVAPDGTIIVASTSQLIYAIGES
jgi:cell division protein FtsI/penicillin-binding protein 2